ncbi:MAG TPA: S8 family peptidase [Pyrinomonadaceae bacterium]|nr:S8 family peptidase [Pyrinomonadaceae bacterium]
MKKITILSLAFAVSLMAVGSFLPVKTSGQKSKFHTASRPIANQYIVVLNEDYVGRAAVGIEVETEAQNLSSVYGGEVRNIYSTALKGYSVTMSAYQAETLSRDDRVLSVEEDSEVSISSTQTNAGWNLDRADQRNLPLDTNYSYTGTGAGAHVYVIDTGVRTTHQEFGGRANVVFDAINDGQLDCNGHGTHVAGTVGGATYGIAKGVKIHSARVLRCDGSGQISDIVAAIDWITAHRINPAIANISITAGGVVPSMETALSNSFASGVLYTAASGNTADDACNYAPGRTPNAITVGATWQIDERAPYSTYGPCVDIFAPGYEIVSAGNSSDTAIRQLNGTSMAAPLVAGVAAIYRAANPSASAATASQAVLNNATTGLVTNPGVGSPNRLLFAWLNGPTSPTPTPTPTPTATPTPTPTATPTPNSSPTPIPATITIKKNVHTRNGGTSSTTTFPYAATNISTPTFSLISNQEFTDPAVPPAGQMVAVSESPVAGYQLVSVECTEVAGSSPNIPNTTVDLANRRANIMVESGESVTCTFTSDELVPTAGQAAVGGRIVDSRGRGVRGINLSLFDATTGETTYATTNSFGYYAFNELEVLDFYVLTAFGNRRFTILDNERSFTLRDDLANVNFIADSTFSSR